jgi:hypothetical protein
MARDNAMIVRGFVDEVITQGNVEAAEQYVWKDVVEHVQHTTGRTKASLGSEKGLGTGAKADIESPFAPGTRFLGPRFETAVAVISGPCDFVHELALCATR